MVDMLKYVYMFWGAVYGEGRTPRSRFWRTMSNSSNRFVIVNLLRAFGRKVNNDAEREAFLE